MNQRYNLTVSAEDIEAGKKKPKFQAEPTLPIFLKVYNNLNQTKEITETLGVVNVRSKEKSYRSSS